MPVSQSPTLRVHVQWDVPMDPLPSSVCPQGWHLLPSPFTVLELGVCDRHELSGRIVVRHTLSDGCHPAQKWQGRSTAGSYLPSLLLCPIHWKRCVHWIDG